MPNEKRIAFFDALADKWDGFEDLSALSRKLDEKLEAMGVRPDEAILDVGTGTGNLALALRERLSPRGRVVGIDLSEQMIERAKAKLGAREGGPEVTLLVGDVQTMPLDDDSVDRVFCLAVWPHFTDERGVLRELSRVLRPGGRLHVWHLSGRELVNAIHASSGEAVCGDILSPAEETAALLREAGFVVETVVDSEQEYLVTGELPRQR